MFNFTAIFKWLLIPCAVLLFTACAKKADTKQSALFLNPLARSFGDPTDTDPLKLGDNPTPPSKHKTLIEGNHLVPKTPTRAPKARFSPANANVAVIGPREHNPNLGFSNLPVFENRGKVSDFLSILGAGGGALTVWALAQGNWIWGYTLVDSISFGDARVWQFITFPKDFVMIKNAKTNTCLNAYKNGIVHYACDQTNPAQFWKLIPMDNQAVQIQNFATQKCIQAPINNPFGDFHRVFSIFLSPCVKPKSKNLDQQWYVIAPPFFTRPLYEAPQGANQATNALKKKTPYHVKGTKAKKFIQGS